MRFSKKLKFWSNVEIFEQKKKVWSKIKILAKNRNFRKFFEQKTQFSIKINFGPQFNLNYL